MIYQIIENDYIVSGVYNFAEVETLSTNVFKKLTSKKQKSSTPIRHPYYLVWYQNIEIRLLLFLLITPISNNRLIASGLVESSRSEK